MNYAGDHHITPSDTVISFFDVDTVMVDYPVTFQQISSNLGISLEYLRFLNPVYRLDLIPETGTQNPLVLPQQYIVSYLRYINKIITSDTATLVKAERTHKVHYIVEKGDFLHKIAIKYGCSPQDIKSWNKLSSDFIAPGQSLIIWLGQ
jgi:membrane-bound lytic murein transglycosylase D